MADRNALGKIGLLLGAATIFVMAIGAVVVSDRLSGQLQTDDDLTTAGLPMTAR